MSNLASRRAFEGDPAALQLGPLAGMQSKVPLKELGAGDRHTTRRRRECELRKEQNAAAKRTSRGNSAQPPPDDAAIDGEMLDVVRALDEEAVLRQYVGMLRSDEEQNVVQIETSSQYAGHALFALRDVSPRGGLLVRKGEGCMQPRGVLGTPM